MLRVLLLALMTSCVVRAAPAPVVYERRVAPPRYGYGPVYRAAPPRCHGIWVEGYYDAWGGYHPGYWRCY